MPQLDCGFNLLTKVLLTIFLISIVPSYVQKMLLYTIDCCLSIFTFQSSIIEVQNFLITLTCFSDSTHRQECFDLRKNIGVQRFNLTLSSCISTVYPQRYTQIHTPTVVQGGGDGTPSRSLWYVAVFWKDFTFSGKPLIFFTSPTIVAILAAILDFTKN